MSEIQAPRISPGLHHAKQHILSHKEVVAELAKRTGLDPFVIDKVICAQVILLQDAFTDMMGLRLGTFGTFRGRLVPGSTKRFGNIPRTIQLSETMSKDRIVPDFVIDRQFKQECKESHYFLDRSTFRELAQHKLRNLLDTRPYDYTQQQAKQANEKTFEEDLSEDVPRRLSVNLEIGKLEKSSN